MKETTSELAAFSSTRRPAEALPRSDACSSKLIAMPRYAAKHVHTNTRGLCHTERPHHAARHWCYSSRSALDQAHRLPQQLNARAIASAVIDSLGRLTPSTYHPAAACSQLLRQPGFVAESQPSLSILDTRTDMRALKGRSGNHSPHQWLLQYTYTIGREKSGEGLLHFPVRAICRAEGLVHDKSSSLQHSWSGERFARAAKRANQRK